MELIVAAIIQMELINSLNYTLKPMANMLSQLGQLKQNLVVRKL